MGTRALNVAHQVYRVGSAANTVVEVLQFLGTIGTFVSAFNAGMTGGGTLYAGFVAAVQATFHAKPSDLERFVPGMNDAFDFIQTKWDYVRTRLLANADDIALDVALDPQLKATMVTHAMKGQKVALVINLPSPPYPGKWTNITLPEIEVRGFRLVLRSAKYLGRLFAIEYSAAKQQYANIVRIDYQDFHYGTHKFDLHYHIGDNPSPKFL